ncbi:MAG: hypothetical protein EBX35_07870, partial [Planctomycetia bacterium]|nr:hypothetical protein [Planctomycetia bacterium]
MTLRSDLAATEIDALGNAADAAVVGELVTHTLTLGLAAGTLRDSVLREAFADALAYVGFLRAETSSPLVTVSGSLTPVLAADGRSLSFALGTIVNADVDPTTTETITFTYRSIVRNVAAARDSATSSSTARFTAAGRVDPVLAVSAPLRILEPRLDVAAAVRIAGGATAGSVGDEVTYELTLGGVAGSPTAHEVAVSWPLPTAAAGSLVSAPTFVVTDTASLVTAAAFELVGSDGAGWTLQTRAGFDVGGDASRRITATISGTVSNTILPGNTTRSAATVTWTSLPGDPGTRAADPAARERTGAGGVDGSRIVALADFRAADFGLTLDVTATSESTGAGRATIGEVVRQRVVSLVPEGDISMASARLRVELPPGLAFVADGSARVALVSDGRLSASRLPPSPGTHVGGGTASGVVPTRPLPAAAILADPGGFGDGGDVIFDFGVLANGDADANDEFIVLEFNALVTNGVGNAVHDDRGTDLVSRARLIIDGFPLLATATDVVTVAEGSLAWLTSRTVAAGGELTAAGPFPRGGRVGQRVAFGAAGGPSRAALHDVQVQGDLPAGATIVPGTIRVLAGQAPAGFRDTSTGSRLDLVIDAVPPGGIISVVYQLDLAGDLAPGSTLAIPLTVRGTTLPGT